MEQDCSHITLGKRIKKCKQAPLGWQKMDIIPPDEACILALPGSNTDNSKKANGFAKMIQDILKDKKMPIYSVEYDLTGRKFRIDREAVLARHGQENPSLPFIRYVKEEDKTYVPQYIKELYAKTIAPRLRDEKGNRSSIETASRRLNMLVFATHCQGSTVLTQLEYLMAQDMEKLGYPPKVQDYLLSQVHSVNVAPVSPYGKTKTSAFKFLSLSDDRVTSVLTRKIDYILRRKKEHENFLSNLNNKDPEFRKYNKPFMMHFSLFQPTKNEIIFAVNNMYGTEIQKDKDFDGIEHAFSSYSDKEDADRTKDGDQLSEMFHLTLNWLAENAKKNLKELTELPSIFKVPAFSKYIARANQNRYDFTSKEVKINKERRAERTLFTKSAKISR